MATRVVMMIAITKLWKLLWAVASDSLWDYELCSMGIVTLAVAQSNKGTVRLQILAPDQISYGGSK